MAASIASVRTVRVLSKIINRHFLPVLQTRSHGLSSLCLCYYLHVLFIQLNVFLTLFVICFESQAAAVQHQTRSVSHFPKN